MASESESEKKKFEYCAGGGSNGNSKSIRMWLLFIVLFTQSVRVLAFSGGAPPAACAFNK